MWRKGDNALLMQLATLEAQIVQMLGYLSEPASSSRLKTRLRQAEECVVQIPDDQEELAKSWREKLADWWAVFASKGFSEVEDETAHDGSMPKPPNVFISGGNTEEPAAGEAKDQFDDVDSAKDAIRAELATMFEPIEPLANLEDADAFHRLVRLIIKTEDLTFAFMRDAHFQKIALEYIIPKLPSELGEKFLHGDDNNKSKPVQLKSVVDLKLFLFQEYKAHQAEEQAKLLERNPYFTAEELIAEAEAQIPGPVAPFCTRCKIDGHQTAKCPENKKQRCFQCFQKGHTADRCPLF